MRLHTAGLSIRETVAILKHLNVERSHGAVWQWTHRLADSEPDPPEAKRVAVDEIVVQIGTEWDWLYAAIDLDSLYLLNIEVSRHHGTHPVAAFLNNLAQSYDLSAVFK